MFLGELNAGTAEQNIVLSDEKLFIIDATVNNHINRLYAKSSAEIDNFVRTVYRQQKPFSLMVCAAVFKS